MTIFHLTHTLRGFVHYFMTRICSQTRYRLRYAAPWGRKMIPLLIDKQAVSKVYKLAHSKSYCASVGERCQIDLMDVRQKAAFHLGETYHYILSVIDIYSRYTFLRPLQIKS